MHCSLFLLKIRDVSCLSASQRHREYCHHWRRSGTLDRQPDIPDTEHRKDSVFIKSGNIGWIAPLDAGLRRSHIHQFHIDAHLHLCIRDRIATTAIFHEDDDSIGITDSPRKDLQRD